MIGTELARTTGAAAPSVGAMRIPTALSTALISVALAAGGPAPASAAGSCRLSGAPARLAELNGNRLALARVSCADANRVVRAYGRLRCPSMGGNTCPRMVDRVRRIWWCSAPTAATAAQRDTVVRCAAGPHVVRVRTS